MNSAKLRSLEVEARNVWGNRQVERGREYHECGREEYKDEEEGEADI